MRYKITKKKQALKDNEDRYMATLELGEYISYDQVLEEMQTKTSLNKGSISSVLINLSELIISKLTQGHPVDLGPIGKIKPRISAQSQKTKEEVTTKTITTKSTLYLPSKEIKDAMNAVKFVKSDSWDEEVEG
jgi:predicted histone-like DNA-binding protein